MARVLTVDLLIAYTQDILISDPILSDIWVRGEVTSLHQSAAGHIYFNLSGEQSLLRCVFFRNEQFGNTEIPKQGDSVAVHGNIGLYPARGEFQLYADQVLSDGLGLAQLEFERLYRKLDGDGLFAEDRKRPLLEFPSVIGVVTSAKGAVWHDVQTVVERRFPLVELVLSPASVQGEAAPNELVRGLQRLIECGRCDLIIIGRGGGSPEELAVFNDETLARAIFASPIPVISAVGHETDITIADLVADCRAPTPSAAAELAVPDQREIRRQIDEQIDVAKWHLSNVMSQRSDQLATGKLRLRHASPRPRIDALRQQLDDQLVRASWDVHAKLDSERTRVAVAAERARLLNPRTILSRGFAAVSDVEDRDAVASAAQARQVRRLRLRFLDGTVDTEVLEVQNGEQQRDNRTLFRGDA